MREELVSRSRTLNAASRAMRHAFNASCASSLDATEPWARSGPPFGALLRRVDELPLSAAPNAVSLDFGIFRGIGIGVTNANSKSAAGIALCSLSRDCEKRIKTK